VNDAQSWEGGVVEGPYILRHSNRFYLFYAGNACCGAACHYAEGVARADRLMGPWLKDPANPIIRPNEAWQCPGHGTAVETPGGEDYFLYHAYPANGTIYLGRESVLDPIVWSSDGWPVINGGQGPGSGNGRSAIEPNASLISVSDDFREPVLDPEWKWPIDRQPKFQTRDGQLTLEASPDGASFLARTLPGVDFQATVSIRRNEQTDGGIGIIGNRQNEVVIACHDAHLELLRISDAGRQVLWETDIKPSAALWLRVSSRGPAGAGFTYSFDDTQWFAAGSAESMAGVPRWDQGLRIGLIATGRSPSRVTFTRFSLIKLVNNSGHDSTQ